MKILIWIACAFVLSLITVSLKYAGILLGFIPTFILGSLMFWAASKLCKMWDIHKQSKKEKKDISISKSVEEKAKRKQKKLTMSLINIIVLVFPILFSVIILYDGTYIDELYFMVVFAGIFSVVLEVLKYKTIKNNMIGSVLLIISSGLMFLPVLTSDLWEEDVVIALSICISSLYVLCYEVYRLFVDKFYNTHSYKMKCYKKVADMQMYLEKGIITQEEFENNKNDILKKIKSEPCDYSRNTAVENTKEFDENKTILNMQEPKESVEPVVRDDAFWEKVKMIYSNLYQENGQVFYQSLAKAELLNFNEKTKNFELNIFDDEAMQRSSIYGAEFDRFIGYVFKSWMQHKIPEMDANEMIKITEIMSSHFNIDDPYVKEIAPDTINRWNDFDKINIDEYLYGFYEGTGHKVEPDEKIEEDSREILATYDAMRWIMTDLIYTTSKTSKTFSYDKTVEYLKENHIMWKDSDDKDATIESMKMIDIYCNLSDIYMSVIQTVNWIASNEFMK